MVAKIDETKYNLIFYLINKTVIKICTKSPAVLYLKASYSTSYE